jgi:hypothetical protein
MGLKPAVLLLPALVVALLGLSGCASLKPTVSQVAQGADAATTAIGIYGYGATEVNPLLGFVEHPAGMAAFAALKVGFPLLLHKLPPAECRPVVALATGLGFGPAAHNLAVIGGSSAALPIGIAVGLASAIWSYHYKAEQECRPRVADR